MPIRAVLFLCGVLLGAVFSSAVLIAFAGWLPYSIAAVVGASVLGFGLGLRSGPLGDEGESLLLIGIALGIAVAMVAAPVAALAADSAAAAPGLSVGEIVSPLLEAVLAAAGTALAGLIAVMLQRQLVRIGVQVTDADRARLETMIANGVVWAAHRAGASLEGAWTVDVRDRVLADTAAYVTANGRDTLRRLRAPTDPAALQQIIVPRAAQVAEGVMPESAAPAVMGFAAGVRAVPEAVAAGCDAADATGGAGRA